MTKFDYVIEQLKRINPESPFIHIQIRDENGSTNWIKLDIETMDALKEWTPAGNYRNISLCKFKEEFPLINDITYIEDEVRENGFYIFGNSIKITL